VCEVDAKLKCSRCRDAWYCGKAHQKLDWKHHRDLCVGSKYFHNPAIRNHIDACECSHHHRNPEHDEDDETSLCRSGGVGSTSSSSSSCCGSNMEIKPLVSQCVEHGTYTYHHHDKENPSTRQQASNDDVDPNEPTQEDLVCALMERHQLKEIEKPFTSPGRVESFVDVRVVFTLVVETDPPPYNRIPTMMNLFAHPHAKLVKCSARGVSKYCDVPLAMRFEQFRSIQEKSGDDEDGQLYVVTKKEMKTCALKQKHITMKSGTQYKAPGGKSYFTLRDLIDVICRDEEVLRRREENFWFGGIDVHNVIFEGFRYMDGRYAASWAS